MDQAGRNSNNRIVLIVGLPGSGKTYLINNSFPQKHRFVAYDDLFAGAVNNQSGILHSQFYPEIVVTIGIGEYSILLSDIAFCDSSVCEDAIRVLEWWVRKKQSNYSFHLVLFENNPNECSNNIKRLNYSNNLERLEQVSLWTGKYDLSKYQSRSFEIVPVYRIDHE